MADEHRIERIEHQMQKEVAAILAARVADPSVAGVTVLWVKVAKDLSVADVYVSVFGDDEAVARGLRALDRCRPIVQRGIGERIRLRKTPYIRFRLDKQYRSAVRVYDILKQLESEQGEKSADQGNSGGD